MVRQLAHAQQATGLDPTVYTMRWPKSLPPVEDFEGISVRRYVFRSPDLPAKRFVAALLLGPVTLLRLVTDMRRRRIEVVHVQCVSPASWYALQACRILRLRLVVTMHGELSADATGLYQRSGWARHTLRALLRRANAITACSSHTLHEAEGWFGRPFGHRSSVIHNGVDPSEFRLAEPPHCDSRYIFAIGRHVWVKGFDLLIEAFAEVAAEMPELDLWIAGDGPGRQALEEQTRSAGLQSRVRFFGETDRATTARLFRCAEAFVLPSRRESFGIVVLEALAAGVPVVASDVGGVREFLPHTSVTALVDADDPRALAAAIESVCGAVPTAADRRRLDEVIEMHTWSAIERGYRALYG